MATLVITVIGDDRPGLVNVLADVVAAHGGSWERSQLAELAGKFAGIVTVDVPDSRSQALAEALGSLGGVLETTVHLVGEDEPAASAPSGPEGDLLHLDLVGNDRPGIVKEITGILAGHQVSVEDLQTKVVPAPQAGGDLFAARVRLRAPAGTDLSTLRQSLEELAAELLVDMSFDADDQPEWE
ncbi:amino acid-binding ACT protein [Serinicoccus chungangensis]|uniref:Amino acid-binding ACT protein n=1 Tax=Serinicoccus chungangensis TaxID=767452 RepID=A0A0W8IHH3_9MICO|nr:ACT domain-containing protein [Serinicoccus chungangensis]KUG59334.1 amino acid-binding ACT protein [Serinicoccus chungangensis]